MDVSIAYRPHAGQVAFHGSGARYRVLCCGRRWGKTKAATAEGVIQAVQAKDGRNWRGWFVAPTWDLGRETWDEFFRLVSPCRQYLVKQVHKTEHTVTLMNGARLQWRSADKEGSLRGAGLDFLVVDEAALVKEDSWDSLEPAVGDKAGRVVLISTPKGHNWFEQQWARGQDSQYPGYESWRFPTLSNPYFPASIWEDMKRNTPEIVFKQEYEAEFIADAGLVFRRITECTAGELEEAKPGHHYVAGVDLARVKDFTVICVMDCSSPVPSVVAWDRFRELDWVIQVGRIMEMAREYRCPVWLDSTGLGDPIYQALRDAGVQAEGYAFTSSSKRNLVNRLILGMEEQDLRFPAIPELVAELKVYEYETLPSGNVRFQGPSRGHDDCVTALALAYWGVTAGPVQRVVTVSDLVPNFKAAVIADY